MRPTLTTHSVPSTRGRQTPWTTRLCSARYSRPSDDRATLCLIDNGDYRWVLAGKPTAIQDAGRLVVAQKSVRTAASSPINLDWPPTPQSAQICDVCEQRGTSAPDRIFCVSRSTWTISCRSRILLGFVLSSVRMAHAATLKSLFATRFC